MRWKCHRVVAGSGAFTGAQLAGAPPALSVVVGVCAWRSSTWPDKLERVGFVEHRASTHSLPAAAAVTALLLVPAGWFTFPAVTAVAAGLAAGYWLHLVADAMTRTGVPGWPLVHRYWLLPAGWRVCTVGRERQMLDPRGARRDMRYEWWVVACWCTLMTVLVLLAG